MNYQDQPEASGGLGESGGELAVGTVVASRFQVTGPLGAGGLGALYAGTDLQTENPVAIRVLAAGIAEDEATLERLREQVKSASALQHKNIVSVLGMGREGHLRFIAMELIEGRSLRELIESKRAAGKTFSLKGTYNVIAHVCNALTEAHRSMVHGLPGPGNILINEVGRIKVCELGVVLALPTGSQVVTRLGDSYAIAPEVLNGTGNVAAAADIYTVGVMLYELLTGHSPADPPAPPSQLAPHLTADVDQVVLRCLAPDPQARFSEAREVKAAFYAAMQAAEARAVAAPQAARPSAPPAQQPAPQPAPQHTPAPVAAAPQVGGPIPPGNAAPAAPLPGMGGPPAAAPQPGLQPAAGGPPPAAAPAAAAPAAAGGPVQADFQTLLNDDGGDPTEKWLVQKGRLDFGPFNLLDLKQALNREEFTGDDVVLDQESGERHRIRSHPLFRDFIILLERQVESRRINEAEADRMQADRKRRAILIGVVTGSLAVLGIVGAVIFYYVTREPRTRERIVYRDRDNLGKVIKGIDINWKAEPKDQAKKRKQLRRRRRRPRRGNQQDDNITRLGDATKEGGDALLSQKVVQNVMASNFGKLKVCVVQQARRDPNMRKVLIEFGVRGTGRVKSVKVNGKTSGPFQSCVYARMRTIKFPAFDGQLTRASFSMNLSY